MTTTTFPNSSLGRANVRRVAPRNVGFGVRLWNALTSLGSMRASSQLDRLARQYDGSRPELARLLRDAAHDGLNG
jgi:hypothetical protein